ncbi:MAG: hypothetical protein IPI67_35690 [Myxococcales bacterium]|nr:hypothetical protein [Myxococcales bacterium]
MRTYTVLGSVCGASLLLWVSTAGAQECVPACAAGSVCQAGVCVAPPPPPPAPAETPPAPPPAAPAAAPPAAPPAGAPPPAAPPYAAPQPGASPAASGAAAAPAAAAHKVRSGFAAVVRAGYIVTGSGERDTKCTGSDCPSIRTEDYDDKSGLVLGADFFGHLSPQFRLGGGLLFAPNTKMETSDGSAKVGSDLSLLAIGEGVFDVGPTTALALRLFVGPAIVIAGSDLKDENDSINDSCKQVNCKFDEGSNAALSYGVGGGVIVDVGSVALRFDLLQQWYSGKGRKVDYSGSGVDATIEEEISGSRTLVAVGLDF